MSDDTDNEPIEAPKKNNNVFKKGTISALKSTIGKLKSSADVAAETISNKLNGDAPVTKEQLDLAKWVYQMTNSMYETVAKHETVMLRRQAARDQNKPKPDQEPENEEEDNEDEEQETAPRKPKSFSMSMDD